MVAMPFIYDTSKGETPETVARKRMLAEQIMGRAPSAVRNVGEGIGSALTSFGNAFRADALNQRADAAEAEILREDDALTRQIYGLMTGGAPYPEPAAGAGAPAPSPGGRVSEGAVAPDAQSVPALANARTRYAEELKDPAVAARLAALTHAEVGGQGPQAQQAFMESTFNRAAARGQTLAQTMQGSYFPAVTHDRVARFSSDPQIVNRYAPTLSAVMGGSNLSGYSTGNASGTVRFNGGPQVISYGGERFGIEGPDMAWANRMRGGAEPRGAPVQVASLDPNFAPPPRNPAVPAPPAIQSQPVPPSPFDTMWQNEPGSDGASAPVPRAAQMALAGGMPAMGGQPPLAPQAFPSSPQLSGMPSSLPAMSASPPQPAPQMAPQQPQPAPQAPQNNEHLALLIQAATSPRARPETRALAQFILQQEMTRRHQATDPAYQAELAYKRAQTQALERKAQGKDASFGLTPQYGVDAAGNPVLLQLGNDGTVRQPQMPDGVTLSNKPIQIDAGTHYVLLDPITRQPVGMVPKNLAGAESQKVQGKAQGEAAASLPSDLAAADTTVQEIDQLLAHPGLPQIVGPLDQFRPSLMMGSEGRDALARYNQLQGRAFLQAYGALRGGGSITEVEGAKAQAAMARMDRAQGEDEFKRALADFRDAVQTGLQKMRERAGVAPAAGGAPQTQAAPNGMDPKVWQHMTPEERALWK